MADKMTFMAKWLEDIKADKNLNVTEQELAYITYAAVIYGVSSEKINIGAIFGNDFKFLNMAMPNIYGQIDNIQNYDPGRKIKYDSDAIKELRLQGKTAAEICEELGYDVTKANSLTSNKGWKEAGQILAQKKKENPDSVQNLYRTVQKNTEQNGTESIQKNTESVQKCTDSGQDAVDTFNF